MLTRTFLVILCVLPLSAQIVKNAGQIAVPYSSVMTLDTSFAGAYVLLTGNVASYTMTPGTYANQPFGLKVCQGEGGPYTVSGQPANVNGYVAINPIGCTRLQFLWDVNAAAWTGSPVGMAAAAIAGAKGDTGAAGQAGSVGPQGLVGGIGPQGLAGLAGANAVNPVFTFSASALSSGSAPTAVLSGVYPALAVALGIPAGAQGSSGSTGATGTAATVTVGTVTALACGATPTVTNVGTSLVAVLNFGIPSCTPISAMSSAIGGTLLAIGAIATTPVTVTGAVAGKNCSATPSDGSLPAGGVVIDCAITTANTATLQLRALVAVTPPSKTYLVTVLP